MIIETKLFGIVEIDESKKLTFPGGIIGFPDLQDFILIHDEEKKDGGIRWMQSIQEPAFAMPVIDPLIVKQDYNPQVEDELLKKIDEFGEEDLLVLVTITVPHELDKMTVNLKAPLVINAKSRKACQVIVEDYDVRYPVYEILKSLKGGD